MKYVILIVSRELWLKYIRLIESSYVFTPKNSSLDQFPRKAPRMEKKATDRNCLFSFPPGQTAGSLYHRILLRVSTLEYSFQTTLRFVLCSTTRWNFSFRCRSISKAFRSTSVSRIFSLSFFSSRCFPPIPRDIKTTTIVLRQFSISLYLRTFFSARISPRTTIQF